jgi:putative oxidoreductase
LLRLVGRDSRADQPWSNPVRWHFTPEAKEDLVVHYLALVGRICFSAIFILGAPGHFTARYVGFAAQAGVPAAALLVPLSGVIALVGGLSIALGYRAKLGALLLVVFLIPVTVTMHGFWAVTDPMMGQTQQAMLMKNVSMLGGALLIAYFGAGPLSLDSRQAASATPISPGR